LIYSKKGCLLLVLAIAASGFSVARTNSSDSQQNDNQSPGKFIYRGAGNPYLPLWEHLPDGEPRVFEDPDNPGKFRIYIIGSHDVRFTSYCGPDIRMWSAPVENLSEWRDEGPYFHLPDWRTMGRNVCT
jgi:hypothetical protein